MNINRRDLQTIRAALSSAIGDASHFIREHSVWQGGADKRLLPRHPYKARRGFGKMVATARREIIRWEALLRRVVAELDGTGAMQ